jgi:hypothetical protein
LDLALRSIAVLLLVPFNSLFIWGYAKLVTLLFAPTFTQSSPLTKVALITSGLGLIISLSLFQFMCSSELLGIIHPRSRR